MVVDVRGSETRVNNLLSQTVEHHRDKFAFVLPEMHDQRRKMILQFFNRFPKTQSCPENLFEEVGETVQ